MSEIPITQEDAEALTALMGTLDALGGVFNDDAASPETLRMSAAALRSGAQALADVL
jgi:hypothetical protein